MEDELILRESGTHLTIRLPVEKHDLVVMVDRKDFTITIPLWEYMEVQSIVKIIVQLYKEKPDHPFVLSFLKHLQKPENLSELKNFTTIYRWV